MKKFINKIKKHFCKCNDNIPIGKGKHMRIHNRQFIIMDKLTFIDHQLQIHKHMTLEQAEEKWVRLSKGFNFVLKEVNVENYYSVAYTHEKIRQGAYC